VCFRVFPNFTGDCQCLATLPSRSFQLFYPYICFFIDEHINDDDDDDEDNCGESGNVF